MRHAVERLSCLSWIQVLLFDVIAVGSLIFVMSLLWQSPPVTASNILASQANEKRIAFSFDDSPRGAGAFLDVGQRPQMLIAELEQAGIVQAVFFVNPGQISPSKKGANAIAAYAAAGHLVANHTQNHLVLSSVSAAAFLADIDAAEIWLKSYRNYRPWLRFPQLDEGGRDLVKRDAVRTGMKARGLSHGFVTADGWDWYTESMTLEAKRLGKPMDIEALRALFIETHVQSAEFSDRLARRIFAKPPAQMLLLHETDLSVMFVVDLAKALRSKGWQIVSADSVYSDPVAKKIPDSAVANGTWLEMLAWEKGLKGDRWFPRNDVAPARKLFVERVLHE